MVGIFQGSTAINPSVGGTAPKEVFVGSTKVWPTGPEPAFMGYYPGAVVASSSTRTWTNVPIGPATPNRWVVAMILAAGGSGTVRVSSISIAGVSAGFSGAGSSTWQSCAIGARKVTASESITISTTLSAARTGAVSLVVYTWEGVGGSAYAYTANVSTSVNINSPIMTILKDGCMFSCSVNEGGTSGQTTPHIWSPSWYDPMPQAGAGGAGKYEQWAWVVPTQSLSSTINYNRITTCSYGCTAFYGLPA